MPRMRTAQDETATTMPPRQRLLQAVLHGEMTPAEAEADATRLGLRPLLDHPDPSVFDPMRADRWTLAMTIAWIVWRTPEAVREHWDAYVIGCERWREAVWNRGEGTPTYRGFEPGPLPTPNWPLLALRVDYPREQTGEAPWRPRSPHDAREELWKALSDGDIDADAVGLDTDRRVALPASAWKSLDLYPELEMDIVRESPRSRSGYRDIRFPMRQVVDAWPARNAPETLPPLLPPDGSGYMPLSAVAQWIVTKGGAVDIGHDTGVWDHSYRELTDRIASADVACTGIPATGERQRLEPALFGGMKIHHLFAAEEIDGADRRELYLWATPYFDEEHWDGGFSDDLRRGRQTVYKKLMVNKTDVRKLWSFAPPPPPPRKRGRPSSELRGPTLAYFRRRLRDGQVEPTVKGESDALRRWQWKERPTATPMARKYIEELIRDEYAHHMSGQKKE